MKFRLFKRHCRKLRRAKRRLEDSRARSEVRLVERDTAIIAAATAGMGAEVIGEMVGVSASTVNKRLSGGPS